jgi:PAS domain S-box-containing protein
MGIRSKILSIAVIMLIVGILAEAVTCGLFFTREYSRALQTSALALGESLRSQLDRIFSLGIPLHELVGFDKQCQELVARNGDIAYAMVVDSHGTVLFCNDPSQLGKQTHSQSQQSINGDLSTSPYILNNEGDYQVVIPILSGHSEKIGAILIGIDASTIKGKIRHLVLGSALVSLVALATAVVLLLLTLRQWVTKPLGELFEAIRGLRRDERGLYGKLALSSRDEIGQVGSAFDSLIDDLNASNNMLSQHAEKLEVTVEKRTAELKSLNEQLKHDIAERKKIEKALRDSEEQYRLLVSRMNDGYFVTDGQGVLTFANEALARLQGIGTPDELLGRQFLDFTAPEARDMVARLFMESVANGKAPTSIEIPMLRQDGRVVHTEAKPNVEFQADGTVVIRGVLRDITERRMAEEDRRRWEHRLQQAQKAESLGRMAGAIAHHFNNMLGAVIGNLELALDDLPQGSEALESIGESMKASRRAAEISRLMLSYLGQTIGRREPLDLAQAIRETLPLLSASTPQQVHLKTYLPPQGPIVLGDAVHMKQVLTNLLSNAVEAIGEKEGDVTVGTEVMAAEDIAGLRFYPLDWQPRATSYACLSVADTGCGMDVATLERIFDPFFSTKFTGRGLGLAVVLGLVRSHEGAIVIESQLGKGATFRVFFPLTEQETSVPSREEPLVWAPVGGGGLVLVVDDEPMVRNMAESMRSRGDLPCTQR